MHLLFLTNFYPPHSRGGYEMWCQEVASRLCHRGHSVRVLTSRHGGGETADPPWVFRELNLEMELASLRNAVAFFTSRRQREAETLDCLRRHVAEFDPDVVLVWGMWNLPRTLPALAEKLLPDRVVYYFGDYWPTLPSQFQYYWEAPAQTLASAIPKKVLGTIALWQLRREHRASLAFPHALFCTAYLRDELQRQDVAFGQQHVVYGGIDTGLYVANETAVSPIPAMNEPDALHLLTVGRLHPDKGIHIALDAIAQLVHTHQLAIVRYHLVGTGDADYLHALAQQVAEQEISDHVLFHGVMDQQILPAVYAQADAFLFPPLWPEPFGRAPLEAMAAGLAVVGAPTGGAAEVLTHGENALTFAAGDATALAEQVLRLVRTPALKAKIEERGRETAVSQFDVMRMAVEIEEYLQTVIS